MLVGLEDDQGSPCLREVIPDREARLTAADYHGVDLLVHDDEPMVRLAQPASTEMSNSAQCANGYFFV
jgi:hypothetical protein